MILVLHVNVCVYTEVTHTHTPIPPCLCTCLNIWLLLQFSTSREAACPSPAVKGHLSKWADSCDVTPAPLRVEVPAFMIFDFIFLNTPAMNFPKRLNFFLVCSFPLVYLTRSERLLHALQLGFFFEQHWCQAFLQTCLFPEYSSSSFIIRGSSTVWIKYLNIIIYTHRKNIF